MIVGIEWLIEGAECEAEKLRDETVLRNVFDQIITDLSLKVVSEVWHKFPAEGGLTGMVLLTESHLTCHTYPEHRVATFNLYCCRSRPEWDWSDQLRSLLGAKHVSVRAVQRASSADLDSTLEISNLKSWAAGGEV